MRLLSRSIAVVLLAPAGLQGQVVPASKAAALIKKARAAHYNLGDQGFSRLEAGILPDWDSLVASVRKTDPAAADRAVGLLGAIHFRMVVGPDGGAKVTHDEVQAPNDQSAQGLAQVYGGMEQMIQGFFQTWSVFEIAHPFPEGGQPYKVIAAGEQHVITYRDGDADIETTLGSDLRIVNTKAHSAKFDSSIQPQFEASPEGFYLVGYQADYQDGKPEEATRLQIRIDTQVVSGMRVPSKLTLVGSYGESRFNLEVRFTDLKTERK